MANVERSWQRVDTGIILDFDKIDGGVGISLGDPNPDDSYPTLVLLGQVNSDGGRTIELVGDEISPFDTIVPAAYVPKRVRQPINPFVEVVLGRSQEHNPLGFDLGRLASRTHLSLQRNSGINASKIALRNLNSRNGTYISMPDEVN